MDARKGERAKEDEKRLPRERERGRRDEISPCPDLL